MKFLWVGYEALDESGYRKFFQSFIIYVIMRFFIIYVIMEGEAANSRPTGEDAKARSTVRRG